jgi:hypothetical protein
MNGHPHNEHKRGSYRYRGLNPQEVIATTSALRNRINARFPRSDLTAVASELTHIASEAQERCEWIAKPLLSIRILVTFLIVILIGALCYSLSGLTLKSELVTLSDFLQALEAATNELLLVGAGLVFLVGIEVRVKRSRGLRSLHELRAMAHIVDMHQLKKDPGRLVKTPSLWTPQSPTMEHDAFHLSRYLDYCSEILSLIGKVAALYSQSFRDPVLLDAADQIEVLTTSFSRKIWQKISLIGPVAERASSPR